MPYPFDGKFYTYSDKNAPKLTAAFNGTKDITLKLPQNLKGSELKWFSVWCREFDVSFGDIKFPANVSFESPIAFPGPTSNDGPNEAEGEPEPNSIATPKEINLVLAIWAAAAALIN